MARHANAMSMPPNAMPARQSAGGRRQAPRLPRKVPPGATNGDHARHQTQPSVISAPLATPNEGGCRQAHRCEQAGRQWCVTKLSVSKLCVCEEVVGHKVVFVIDGV